MVDDISESDVSISQIREYVQSSVEHLRSEIPQQPDINLSQRKVSYDNEIHSVNAKAESAMVDAKAKLINLYIDCEKQRLDQQKPLLQSVIDLTIVMVVLFNIIIGLLSFSAVALCFFTSDAEIMQSLFDFLKYYVGAVMVELLGMLAFVTKSIFSSNYTKIIDSISGNTSKQGSKKE